MAFNMVMLYEGHGHYVMMIKVNPRDHTTFATASLDRTGIFSLYPHYTPPPYFVSFLFLCISFLYQEL